MKLAEENIRVPPGEVKALEEAFEHFSRQTAQLKEAYLQLRARAEQVDTELESANRELEQKVQELDEAYNFQRSILESIPTAVVVTDLEGRVRTFNPAAEAMWNRPREEAMGAHFREVMQPHHELLERVLEGESPQESQRRELQGEQLTVISSTACRVEDSSGRPIGAVQLDRDITRLCALQLQLYQQGKLADLGKMAAGLAHEIRKPLNGIKGFASILQRRPDDDDAQDRCVDHIVGAVDRLNNLLSRLLDFARPDGVKLAPCDLREEAHRIAEFVRAERPGTDGRIRVRVPDEVRWVVADSDKIKQVLLNLVQNGMEALDGEGTVHVAASAADTAEPVRVEVRDTGRGMTREQKERILEPFYTDKDGGTGLGLCIVHRILQLHDSRLEVESAPGEGTRVSFLLSRAPAPEET